MKVYLLSVILTMCLSLSGTFLKAQSETNSRPNNTETGFMYPTSFTLTRPLSELVDEHPYVEPDFNTKPWISPDRKNRPAQAFVYSVEDGPEYGNDPAIVQTKMGDRSNANKAPLTNWAGVTSSAYPPDPTGAVGPNHYIQIVNATTVRIFNKTGTALETFQLATLWGSSSNAGDPIVMYDKFADRWFLSQFADPYGSTPNNIYIAISQTNDPTGNYYTYTYTSDDFPDYLKFSIWHDGYYMTSNQSTDKIHVFERTAMLVGNTSARMTYSNFSTGSVSSFFIPLPADAADDDALPAAGTPLPFFSYFDNAWGTGNDAVKIWNATTSWGTTPSVTITGPTAVNTNSFDASYNSSWNDVPQPNGQYLDGIGGVLMYRAPWRSWSSHNSVVLSWGVLISNTPRVRAIYWCELRQTSGTWSMYQQGIYQPDSDTRWMSSAAMDDNGSIALCYAKSSTTLTPGLYYTGRLASDPLGTMTFAETTAIAGNASQSGANRFGDYSQTSLDPDGITFWHTGQYCASTSGQETRIYSFQLPAGASTDVSNFNATAVSTSEIDLSWVLNGSSNPVLVAWNTTNTFGTPVTGTAYAAGNAITGGGNVIYYGSATSFNHTGLNPSTTYYYKAWSNTGSYTWSTGVTDNATTLASGTNTYPFTLDFESSTDYTTSFAPWTTSDVDGLATYSSGDATFTGEGTAFAYMCMNPVASGWTAAQTDVAHGGSRCGMAICPSDGSASDDWFISPAMALGTNSSFSLWVLSPKPSTWGNDSYQIMVSTTDNQPASFTALSSVVEAPSTWTQHTYSLSTYDNQTIYLAIRHVTTDMFMFWMDDLEFNSTVAAGTAAAVVTDPASTSVCPGTAVSFTVTASGDPTISYQWQKNGVNIAGATSSTYTIASVTAGDTATYRCVVTNSFGNDTSNGAVLTINAATSITSQPVSINANEGDDITLTVGASGGSLTYQWKKNNVNISNGGNISGATSAALQILNVSASDFGTYTCAVTGTCGSVTSSGAIVNVLTSIDESESKPEIFPNPSSGVFTIRMGQTPVSGNYYVYDADGRLILWRMYSEQSEIVIDLHGRAQGAYLFRIDAGDKTYFNRLIIKN
ncbi:MAG: hypothetical protein A2W93_06790 [Bacteroidetes bacterium GWF2_43_63]|nr:MAG: hypothetical protein A2W94_07745 [Bacteroidetes bacterium GWE2_42_42]OFY53325.1 MAG: hypothetical protein A2W93_06790 [Bacteroidetes bacterium GWF2_43_63]HBG71679.1 hypothetical protein [Bacteroidales bacterium]HCB61656.1 hypothetical protein [Bacteroidales bacterium]HCY22868.1 hypothetical protein [Bacteroidales bacterium]